MPGGPLLGNRLARSCIFKARFRARWRVGASRIPLLGVLPPSLGFVVQHSFQSNPTGERSPRRGAPKGKGLASATAGTAQESRGRKASPARNAMDSCRGRLASCQQAGPAPRGARIMHGETGPRDGRPRPSSKARSGLLQMGATTPGVLAGFVAGSNCLVETRRIRSRSAGAPEGGRRTGFRNATGGAVCLPRQRNFGAGQPVRYSAKARCRPRCIRCRASRAKRR